MKKMITLYLYSILIVVITFFLNSNGLAASKVVIIPMGGATGNATPPDVLEGKTFSSKAGKGLTGTLQVNGILEEVDPTVAPSVKDGVSWGEVTGIPAGFADNTDNDSGGDITGVTAGTGLDGGGTSGSVTVNADTTYLQRRVSSSCTAGSSIRAISDTGDVTCEADDTGTGDITEVAAGTGLDGGGTSGSVTVNADTTYLQRRVSSSCTAGSSIRAISDTGDVTCDADVVCSSCVDASDLAQNSVTASKLGSDLQVSFHVFFSGAAGPQSVPDNTITKVPFDYELHNDGNHFDTSTGDFVIPADGVYHFNTKVTILAAPTLTYRIYLYVNGAIRAELFDYSIGDASAMPRGSGGITIKLNAADVVDIRVIHYAGAAGDVSMTYDSTWFSGHRVY